jgi:hypothetical protein
MPRFPFSFPSFHRRRLLQTAALALSAPAWPFAFCKPQSRIASQAPAPVTPAISPGFPTQPPEVAHEMVLVSHFDLKRVQQLVDGRPSLARAAWDWGFGDWESALGAASHMGNRPIAEYLLSKGARPSIFSAAMLGQFDVVKSFITTQSGLQHTRGPHSISLLAHAKAGGPAASHVYDYLVSLGDAGSEPQATLTQADLDAIVGVYPFGIAENDRIDVTAERNSVSWTRAGTMGRSLFHLGNRVFYPGGAEAVRIAFVSEPTGTRMTIHDPDVVLSVLRTS